MKPHFRGRLSSWWKQFVSWMMTNPPNPLVWYCLDDGPNANDGPIERERRD